MTDDPIERVVLLIMENHSFDQMLGCMREKYPDLDGVDPSRLHCNVDKDGRTYYQKETCELQMRFDPNHDHANVMRQIANNNSGFVHDFSVVHPRSKPSDRQDVMGYYSRGFLPALHTLAEEFVICDKWFSSLPGPTWPNRFFALSGTSHGVVVMPEGMHVHPTSFLEQTQETVFQRLSEAGKSWRVYHYDMPSSWVLMRQLEPQNLIHYHGAGEFFEHARKGDLPDFTFIEPKYFGQDQNDDHPPHNIMKAEKLIADVYNAVRSNPALWESTLFVTFYDEHGGFFDHVNPPTTVPPDDYTKHFAFDRFGVRVPALLVSPWLEGGVDHTEFDHTSLLKYLTGKWGLGPLGNRTVNSNGIEKALHFLDQPRQDTVPFIRVPNSMLYAPSPELELYNKSAHHVAFELFSGFLAERFQQPQLGSQPGRGSLVRKCVDWIGKRLTKWGNSLGQHYQKNADRIANLADHVKATAQSAD